ncbi:Endo-1,4-beta-xylanase 1 [Sesamum angolense]|uniref:Endo-1,4-beta-xylanase 1 n=1 Tax=Sesamum angolense TaxID=2727404 RepID=A0AAE1X4X0_9LAMI|nr:Endo-1,4-beta-xylanase 1 [Sesamum angolense]
MDLMVLHVNRHAAPQKPTVSLVMPIFALSFCLSLPTFNSFSATLYAEDPQRAWDNYCSSLSYFPSSSSPNPLFHLTMGHSTIRLLILSLDQDKRCGFSSDKGQPRHGRNNNKMHRDCDCKAELLSLDSRNINIAIASASLQPFTEEQWRLNQEAKIYETGLELHGAAVRVEQVSKDFPFGSAIAKTIIGNEEYQKWFVERFNAAVFENELKWDATEHIQGQVNYTIPDQMLEFVRANQIIARGHNIFWENPKYTPKWVLNLTRSDLELAVSSRIQSLMNKYKREFVHWDVSNEMLHFDFYEERLGADATLKFFKTAHEADPLATLFMNEFNVVETCEDVDSTVDAYVSRMRELKLGGVSMDGIGLQGHFDVPNSPLMRGILDKLATLGLPIWLTEVDISNKFSKETQAIYLEQVLREGFSHPAVNGIILWTALRQGGCYQMCLTDGDFNNLPAGDTVDKLLKEWQMGLWRAERMSMVPIASSGSWASTWLLQGTATKQSIQHFRSHEEKKPDT